MNITLRKLDVHQEANLFYLVYITRKYQFYQLIIKTFMKIDWLFRDENFVVDFIEQTSLKKT